MTTPERVDFYPYSFRPLDGDGRVCYYGRSKTSDDDASCAPLDFAKTDSGCTSVEYLDAGGDWHPL